MPDDFEYLGDLIATSRVRGDTSGHPTVILECALCNVPLLQGTTKEHEVVVAIGEHLIAAHGHSRAAVEKVRVDSETTPEGTRYFWARKRESQH
jgi:hypothetical protein